MHEGGSWMVAGSAPSGPGRAIWRPTPWLIGVVAIGALTRAVLLDQVMRQDEAVTLARFARSFTSAFTDYSAPNNHMLHSALVHLSTAVLGPEPWVIRLPAFVFGVALVVAVAWWVGSAVGQRAGLLAAALVAGSSFLIEYSTIARGYTMVAVAFVLLMELSRRLLLEPSLRRWIAWVVISVLGFVTIPVFALPFAAVTTWLVLNVVAGRGDRPASRTLVSVALGVGSVAVLSALAYFPLLIATGGQAVVDNVFVQPLPWADLPGQWRGLARALVGFVGRDGLFAGFYSLLIVLSIFENRRSFAPFLTPAVAMLGPVVVVVVLRLSPPSRVWLFAWPLALGLAGAGLSRLLARIPRFEHRRVVSNATAILLAAAMGLTVIASNDVLRSREAGTFRDGPQVAAWLVDELESGDRVVVVSHPRPVLEYYLGRAGWVGLQQRRDYGSADRLYVIVYHPRPQDLEVVLTLAEVPRDRFSSPELVVSFPETDVYLMEADGAPPG